MTFGCQDLSKHLRILMFSSSLSKILPRMMRWFTMWVNLFCTSEMFSPFNILNISYSWIKACFLALFISVVPSWVTPRMSHVSFAEAHCEHPEILIRIYSSNDVFSNTIILSSFTFTLSPLGPRFLNENIILFNFRNKRAICNNIPDPSINWFKKDFHSNLPKLIIQTTKQRWSVYWSTLPKG